MECAGGLRFREFTFLGAAQEQTSAGLIYNEIANVNQHDSKFSQPPDPDNARLEVGHHCRLRHRPPYAQTIFVPPLFYIRRGAPATRRRGSPMWNRGSVLPLLIGHVLDESQLGTLQLPVVCMPSNKVLTHVSIEVPATLEILRLLFLAQTVGD